MEMKEESKIEVKDKAAAAQTPKKELNRLTRLREDVLLLRFHLARRTDITKLMDDTDRLASETALKASLEILEKIDRSAILPGDLQQKLDRGAIISFSFSTLDEHLAELFEPGAPAPQERLETLRTCKEAGFLVGVNFIPVLPFLSDSEEQLEAMIRTAKDYGADFVLVGGLTLFGTGPTDSKTRYYKVLEEHFPVLVPKYKSLFRIFFAPPKEYQNELEKTSKRLCERCGIRYRIIT